jgi:signal transduction histidine kinase
MQNVVALAATVAMCLMAAQAGLVLIRTPSCVRRSVPILLAAFLLAVSLHLALPRGSSLRELIGPALLWAAGAFLIQAARRGSLRAWTGAVLAFLCSLAIARALGRSDSIPYEALRAFGTVVLSAVPLGIALECWRHRHSAAALAAFISGMLWMACAGRDSLGVLPLGGTAALSPLPVLLLSLCTGWLVFQEGYPERSGWHEGLVGLAPREGMVHALHARLLETESALVGHERLAAAGFLALGAAHEFKNILSLVRLTAAHGISRGDPGEKDACFRLIVEHTNTARDSAVDVLGRLSTSGAEEAGIVDARDLSGAIRRAGAGLRAEGIVIETDLGAGVMFRARRLDVEQIVVNLIHNAADGYRRCPCEGTRTIAVHVRREDELAVIEVRDSAGGIDDGIRPELFSPSRSGAGGSGLGLYLSRSLALSNQGSLDYQPIDGGSLFSLTLPASFPAEGPRPDSPRT